MTRGGDWKPPIAPGFVAEHETPCGLCEETIAEGDAAAYVDDEPCHASCATEDGFEVRTGS